MKINQISKVDFEKHETEVDDELYDIAKEIQKQFGNLEGVDLIVSTKNKGTLIINHERTRKPGEKRTHAYQIKISEVPFY